MAKAPTEPMVKAQGVHKYFDHLHVLKGVDLEVGRGEVCVILGPSGSGKSTFLRCINQLESISAGRIYVEGELMGMSEKPAPRKGIAALRARMHHSTTVEGTELAVLPDKEISRQRAKIGMVFQHFHLFPHMTALENVMEGPLQVRKIPKSQARPLAEELLGRVGLADRMDHYPSELSGGQKQRVAIARALANNPDILLSDEATSALDPNTTKSILKLLRQLHDTLGLTIVIITHQMSVVKQICNKVAVIDHGTIVEEGRLFDIFVNPQAPLTKSFVATTSNLDKVNDLIEEHSPLVSVGDGGVLLRMRYISKEVSEALVSHISRQFDIDVNIVFGDIDVVEGSPLGGLVVVITGDRNNILAAIDYLKNRNIGIEVLAS